MLDVADPALHEAGRFGELHLADASLTANGADSSAQGKQVRRWRRHDYRPDSPLSCGVPCPGRASPPDDLRDALVAHAHDLRNGRHWQTGVVGGPYGLIAALAQFLTGPLQLGFALGVVLGKGRQAASGLGSLAFGAGDLGIV